MPKLDSKSDSVHITKTSLPELSSCPNVKKDNCFPCLCKYSAVFTAVLWIKREHPAAAVQAELKGGCLLIPNTSVFLQP